MLGPRTRVAAWHLVGAWYRFADGSLAVGWVGFRFALRAPVEREQVSERWEGLLPLLLVEFAPALSACG